MHIFRWMEVSYFLLFFKYLERLLLFILSHRLKLLASGPISKVQLQNQQCLAKW